MMRKALVIAIACSASILSTSAAAQPSSSGASDDPAEATGDATDERTAITVTGARRERQRPAPTGSRVSRREPLVRFQVVATETGVAGLLPGSGMDPFAGGTRTVTETTCRSDNERLTAEAACRLAPIQRLVNSGSFEEARSVIDRLVNSESATDEERYIAAGFLSRIGIATREDADREDALRLMLATTSMPAAQRPVAYRTLISLTLRRNDSATAMGLLEQLVRIDGDDARSRANLASLYAAAGRDAEAAALVRDAISIAHRRGEHVPSDWLTFASSSGGSVAAAGRRPN